MTNLIHKISKHGFSAHRFWIVHSPNRLHYLQSTTHAQGKVTDVPALNVWVFVDEHHQQQRRYGFVVEQILGWLVFASKFFGPDSAHYRWFWRHTQSGWKCFPTYVKIGVFMSLKQDFETKCCQYCCSHVMTLDFGHAIFRGIESTFAVFLDICCNFERKTSKQEILCVKSHWPPIHLPQPPRVPLTLNCVSSAKAVSILRHSMYGICTNIYPNIYVPEKKWGNFRVLFQSHAFEICTR